MERRHKFWMVVILRDAPLENKNGKVIGEADQLRLLGSGSSRMLKQLNQKHKRRDLARRDVEISRDGEGFDTQYEVEWATDEDVPLSRDDRKLIEDGDEIIDAFKRYTEMPDEDSFYEEPKFDNDDDDEDRGEKSLKRGSVFNKARSSRTRKSSDDDNGAKPKGIAAARAKAAKPGTKKTIKRIKR
jgi:hypothetical protein